MQDKRMASLLEGEGSVCRLVLDAVLHVGKDDDSLDMVEVSHVDYKGGYCVAQEACPSRLSFKVKSPRLVETFGTEDARYLVERLGACGVDLVASGDDDDDRLSLEMSFSQSKRCRRAIEVILQEDLLLPSCGIRLREAVCVEPARLGKSVEDVGEQAIRSLVLKKQVESPLMKDVEDLVITVAALDVRYASDGQAQRIALKTTEHRMFSQKEKTTRKIVFEVRESLLDESELSVDGQGTTVVIFNSEADMIDAFLEKLHKLNPSVICVLDRNELARLEERLSLMSESSAQSEYAKLEGRWIIDRLLIESCLEVSTSMLINAVKRDSPEVSSAAFMRAVLKWQCLEDIAMRCKREGKLLRHLANKVTSTRSIITSTTTKESSSRPSKQPRTFDSKQDPISTATSLLSDERVPLSELEPPFLALFPLEMDVESVGDSLFSLSVEVSRRGSLARDRFVQTMMRVCPARPTLQNFVSTTGGASSAPPLLTRIHRALSARQAREMTADELLVAVRDPNIAVAQNPALSELKSHYLLYMVSPSNQRDSPWSRLLGPEAAEKIFSEVTSRLSLSEILSLLKSACDLPSARTMRLSVLVRILDTSPDILAFADLPVKRCAGSAMETLIRAGDEQRARTLFEAMGVVAGDGSGRETEEDAFELTTPYRLRDKVESWRRLGERARHRQSLESTTDVPPPLDLFSLWVRGIQGDLALNTVACVIGTVVARSRPLSPSAMAISTQPDEENLIPVAFIAGLIRAIHNLTSTKKETTMNEAMAFAFGCVNFAKELQSEIITALPEDAAVVARDSFAIDSGDTDFQSNLCASLLLSMSSKLFHVMKFESSALRTLLERCVVQISPSAQDLLTCRWAREILRVSSSSPAVAVVVDTASTNEVLREERLALAHLRNVVRRPEGSCAKCCPSGFILDAFWKVHVVCSSSEQSLIALAQILESSSSISGLRAQLDSPGVNPRIQVIAKGVCDRLREYIHPGWASRQDCVRRINALLRVLGALSFAHPTGRTSVIDFLCWDRIIGDLLPLSSSSTITVRVNSFVLLHEIITNASMSQRLPGRPLGTATSTASSSFFVNKRDDVLLVEIDRKHRLGERLLMESVDVEDANTACFALDSSAKMVEMYRSKSNCDEQKRHMAQAVLDFFCRAVAPPSQLVSLLGRDDKVRGSFSRFVEVVVAVCPLLHRAGGFASPQASAMIGVNAERQQQVKLAVMQMARFVDRSTGEKLVSVLHPR